MMITMVFAGYETTASALGFALYVLATNPDLQAEFHAELDEVLDGDRSTFETVDDLEFTRRILKETLRLYPPIHTLPRQTTQPVNIGDYHLPADEEVHLSVLSVHRDD